MTEKQLLRLFDFAAVAVVAIPAKAALGVLRLYCRVVPEKPKPLAVRTAQNVNP